MKIPDSVMGEPYKTHIRNLNIEEAIVASVVALIKDGYKIQSAELYTEGGLQINFCADDTQVSLKEQDEQKG